MKTAKARKFPPQNERADDLRNTVISCINHKLQRMDIDQLREILNAATKIIERKK